MAGAFGYGADTHAVSLAMGELSLLPAVRRAAPDAIIAADGFSCRHQIRDGTGRAAAATSRASCARRWPTQHAGTAAVTMPQALRPMAAPRLVDAAGTNGRLSAAAQAKPTTRARPSAGRTRTGGRAMTETPADRVRDARAS